MTVVEIVRELDGLIERWTAAREILKTLDGGGAGAARMPKARLTTTEAKRGLDASVSEPAVAPPVAVTVVKPRQARRRQQRIPYREPLPSALAKSPFDKPVMVPAAELASRKQATKRTSPAEPSKVAVGVSGSLDSLIEELARRPESARAIVSGAL